ncbi:flagellar hook-basal body protein [Bacillus sp. DNRA2]|uniref:flagellar hook-basal body protein n=1 Tax=Bacillus sp. DNRA2 TaxID=2723053 RepID=UPI00145EFF77|nr:flagellar hook-basal body protein [Bacillus sp. DNRA2]NMD69126.1 flagellar hook-basal body protein [Bacillus sp. DNRA2]
MLRGLNTAASGMFSLERKQEALTNNLANAQTAGYKKDDAVQRAFPNYLLGRINDFKENGAVGANAEIGQRAQLGEISNGVYTQELIPSFGQGTLVQTSSPLDVAIEDSNIPYQTINGRLVKPAAFFPVQMADGTVGYTRNGKFDLDANGNLVTADGYRVLGANHQPIQITESIQKADLSIDTEGNIMAYANDPTRTRSIGKIGLVVAQNPNDLVRRGENLYGSNTALPFVTDPGNGNPGVLLHQGFIEQSNVDTGQTMADMMVTIRGYEANQKVISAYDQSLQQLYSVGKING